ncbi:hypothetical protein ACK9YZ_29430 [Rhizobium sp. ZK1]|uniref:hypothetical protein n=1 Tax=Rhizobium sp. ZK1 TaxID=3389872 RepID=UPI0039F6F04C
MEEWPDRATLDAHCRAEHFTRLVPLIKAHRRQDATFILMDAFVDEQVIGDTEFFLPGLLDHFAIKRQDDFDGFRLDEILSDDLEHSTIFLL